MALYGVPKPSNIMENIVLSPLRCDVLAMFLKKNIDVDVFDDVLQNTKHRANDASNDVNRPPLPPPHHFCGESKRI